MLEQFSAGASTDRSFSVVIPAYRAEATIAACLERLARCPGPPREVVVVDDASPDATAELASRPDVRVHRHTHNLGAGAARNTGVRLTQGDIVVFVDADVLVPLDTFRHLERHFAGVDPPAAVTSTFSVDCPAKTWYARHKNLYSVHMLSSLSDRLGTLNTSLTAIPRDVLARCGGFDEQAAAAEDNALGAAMAVAGDRIVLDQALAVEHLKELSLGKLLREDWTKSYWIASQLWARGAALPREVLAGIGHHHRPSVMASVATAYLVAAGLIAKILGLGLPADLVVGAAGATHLMLNWSYYQLVARQEGVPSAILSAAVHFVEMLVGGAAVAAALVDDVRKRCFTLSRLA